MKLNSKLFAAVALFFMAFGFSAMVSADSDVSVSCSGCHSREAVEVGKIQSFNPVINGSSNFTVYICGDRLCSDEKMLCVSSSEDCSTSAKSGWDLSQNYWVRVFDRASGSSDKVYGGRFLVQKRVLGLGRSAGINISLEGEEARTLYVTNQDSIPHSYRIRAEPSEGEGEVFVSLDVDGQSGGRARFQVDSRSTKSVLAVFSAASCYGRCVRRVDFVLKDLDTGERYMVSVPVEVERRQTGVSAPGIGVLQFGLILALALGYVSLREFSGTSEGGIV